MDKHETAARRALAEAGYMPLREYIESVPPPPKPPKAFRCAECHKGFQSRGSLLQHNKARGHGEMFACSQCGKTFPTERGCNQHFRDKHLGETHA